MKTTTSWRAVCNIAHLRCLGHEKPCSGIFNPCERPDRPLDLHGRGLDDRPNSALRPHTSVAPQKCVAYLSHMLHKHKMYDLTNMIGESLTNGPPGKFLTRQHSSLYRPRSAGVFWLYVNQHCSSPGVDAVGGSFVSIAMIYKHLADWSGSGSFFVGK